MNTNLTNIHDLAPAIAKHLPPGWRYAGDLEREGPNHTRLAHDDGPGLALHLDYGRLEIGGRWPDPVERPNQSPHHFYPHDTKPYRIGCSAARGAEAIAADIKRRLLPGYLLEWRRQAAMREQYVEGQERVSMAVTKLATIVGAGADLGRASLSTKWGTKPGIKAEVGTYQDMLEVKLTINCDYDDALRIARLIRDMRARSIP